MFKRMYLEITNVCNLRCAFCPGTQRPRRFMTPEEFRQLATRLRPYGTYLMLHVMGEPLLHPQLAELLDIAGELDFRVCLVTNGTLLPRQLPTLEASPVLHKLSVDKDDIKLFVKLEKFLKRNNIVPKNPLTKDERSWSVQHLMSN